ncbi:hypothetical protein MSG28_009045 [Choristoneura fumiferana]|uniref:Uncharacterized protein n=1 Tax=Choristoneura fumiferana TaxID=7141 RepID=A0ACC0KW38_CHOFU|nr:hypothetical protein MSG28_009045 [Choristoneura fumiferana]
MLRIGTNLCFIFVLTFHFATSDVNRIELPESSRMVGVDTIHDVKIDKDTIISQNLKLEKRSKSKNVHRHKKVDEEPDWSYSAFPADVETYVQEFKQNMSECLKEVQAADKRQVKRLSPKTESPVHGECLIACVLKRNKVIENGKISKANLISLVNKFYSKDTRMMKKLDKNLDRCIEMSAKISDECALASHLNDCTNDLMASNKHKITVNY